MVYETPETTPDRVLGSVQPPTDWLDALHLISRRLLSRRPETLVADVLDLCRQALGAEAGLLLWQEPGGALTPGTIVGLPAGVPASSADRPPFDRPQTGPALVGLMRDRLAEPLRWLRRLHFSHVLIAPLPATGAPAHRGFALFCFRQTPPAGRLTFGQVLADQLAMAEQEARLEMAEAQLEAAVAQQKEAQELFLSAVSHEIKGPLTNMQGYTQLVIRYPDAPPVQRARNLETILTETRRLTRLINEMTEAARLENSSLEIVLQPVDLAALVREIADQAARSAAGQQRGVVVEGPTALPAGNWDRDRLGEAIGYLVEHALQESPPGHPVRISVAQVGEEAIVELVSGGTPADSEALRNAFVPFYRLAKPARIRGVGLGLPLARLIVERLGGRIEAEPIPGEGNRYRVELPLEVRGQGAGGGGADWVPPPGP
ncbi:MAG: hypothetical protein HY331_19480 [Chloroflexi bacterium]|nr:hypothetical protein [Chloroflexota bacterium]